MREILSGNEAIARGAWEAGVRLAAAYPGTPSTEILENIATYPDVYSEWAPNEKVALEVGLGAAVAGARALVAMKHVGVNVAADPLFTASYTGIKGGLLVDIGVPVFLPASQVDIRKPGDISRFIGKEVECKVLKIDVENRNIVVSRRKLIEEERRASKDKILNEIEVGQDRSAVGVSLVRDNLVGARPKVGPGGFVP